jgi:hypothetical protein
VAEGFAHKVSLFGGCQVESENKNTFSVNFENSTPAYFCFFRFYFPHKSQIGENPFFVRFVSKTTLEVVHSTTLFFFWQKKSQQNRTEQQRNKTDGRTDGKKERENWVAAEEIGGIASDEICYISLYQSALRTFDSLSFSFSLCLSLSCFHLLIRFLRFSFFFVPL